MNTRGKVAAASVAQLPQPPAAPAAPVAAAKKKKLSKGSKAVGYLFPAWTGGDLDVLKDENVLEIFTFLTPKEATNWSACNSSMLALTVSPLFDQIWRKMLYSKVVDTYGEYSSKVPAERRAKIEAHFSCKRVVAALLSSTCSACGEYAENLNLMSCSRACHKCWSCAEAGPKGIAAVCRFGLCAVSYAKTHYLLSDKEIKSSLFCLDINDETKAHGLMHPKMTLVLESEALLLGIEKFGSKEALVLEKTSRASKAKDSYDLRCEDALSEGKKKPVEPDSIRRERAKDKPEHTNYVTANQSFISGRPSIAAEYGFVTNLYNANVLLTQLPSVFVTRDTPAEVMAKHPHVTQALLDSGKIKISQNIYDAVYVCKNGGTLLVDMVCDLPTMALTADATSGARISNNGMTVAGVIQVNCLLLPKDVKILGTCRGSVKSTLAIFWVPEYVAVHLEHIKLTVRGVRDDEEGETYCPALVLSGHCTIKNCELSTNTQGYCLLAHGKSTTVTDSSIASYGCPRAVHVNFLDNMTFKNNTISSYGDDGEREMGFYFGKQQQAGENEEGGRLPLPLPLPLAYTPEEIDAFIAQLKKDNEFSSYYDCDY